MRHFLLFFTVHIIFSTASLLAQVNIERNRNLDEDEGFAGSVDFNLQVTSGNVDVLDTGAEIRFQYVTGRNYLFLISNAQYATKNSKAFVNRGFAHLRYNYEILPYLRWELFFQNESNEFTRLFNRRLFGTGARFQMVKEETVALHFGTTFMLEYEHIDIAPLSGDIPKTDAMRWSNYLSVSWDN